MDDKEKLRRLIEQGHDYYYSDAYNGASVYEAIAEYLIMKGVRLKEGADNGRVYRAGSATSFATMGG